MTSNIGDRIHVILSAETSVNEIDVTLETDREKKTVRFVRALGYRSMSTSVRVGTLDNHEVKISLTQKLFTSSPNAIEILVHDVSQVKDVQNNSNVTINGSFNFSLS
ncbi:MAG: hypothetical protein LBL16_02835 [Endomicrobium sp.]|jgi:hypothetical protein|nr:hypothetical protein [Endomicrobium sp.]